MRLIVLGDTTELCNFKLCLLFIAIFILVVRFSSVSPRHSSAGWQNAFEPSIRFVNVAVARCPSALLVQAPDA